QHCSGGELLPSASPGTVQPLGCTTALNTPRYERDAPLKSGPWLWLFANRAAGRRGAPQWTAAHEFCRR
ncbi:MAG: hypothetical protein WCF79_01720, partial [Rhodomicrobium sp.]